jgi:hypothetical protein
LRSLAESRDSRLAPAWPRATRRDDRLFRLLNRAYVEARYSPHFKVELEELMVLMERARRLAELVDESCREWLGELRRAAGEEARG